MKDFSKDDTKVVKGVAILLMIALHCFAFPDRIGNYDKIITLPLEIHGETLLQCVSKFGIICLSIYTFLSGIGMYKQYNLKGEYSVSKRIIGFYKEYWKVFIIFLPIGFLFFRNQNEFCENSAIYNIFKDVSLEKIIKDFVGMESNYNREWWFVKTYFFALILGYIYMKLLSKCKSFWLEFFAITLITTFYHSIAPNLNQTIIASGINSDYFFRNFFYVHNCVPLIFMGIVVAKYDILSKIYELLFAKYNKFFKIIFSVLLIAILIYVRNYCGFIGIDLIIVPIFVVCIINIFKPIKVGYKILKVFGENSTTMWLVHSFYCYYFGSVQKLLYSLKSDILIFAAIVVLSLVTSVIIKHFYNIIDKYLLCKFIKEKSN